MFFLFVFGTTAPKWARASLFLRFIDHTKQRTTFGRTPLDEWSARRRDLYLTTHNTNNTQTSMPPVGFEHTISAGEWSQSYALDSAVTGTGSECLFGCCNSVVSFYSIVEYVCWKFDFVWLCGCWFFFFWSCRCGICPEFLNLYVFISVRKERAQHKVLRMQSGLY